MRRGVSEVAVKSGLERLGMTERTNRGFEGVERGDGLGREHIEHLDARRVNWLLRGGKCYRRGKNGSVLGGPGNEARAHAQEGQHTNETILHVLAELTFVFDQCYLRERVQRRMTGED